MHRSHMIDVLHMAPDIGKEGITHDELRSLVKSIGRKTSHNRNMAFEQVGESLRSLSSTALRLVLLATLLLLWGTSLAIYRLFFSPLSKFPGPKLAAVTGWVETYHDVFRGGQLIFKLGEWHEKYGSSSDVIPC
jgi:hypothetical protein